MKNPQPKKKKVQSESKHGEMRQTQIMELSLRQMLQKCRHEQPPSPSPSLKKNSERTT